MKITFKRVTASLLLLALVLGLVGGIPVMTKTDAAVLDADGNEVTNLLEGMNPSFDEFSIPNWTVSDCVSQCDQQTYGTGTWSLKITDKSSSKSYYAVNDKVEIKAGEQYTISAQVYGAAIGELTVAFFDAADKELSGKAITVKMSAKASSWKELTKTFTAPAGTATAQVKVASTKKGTGTVYFDAISLSSKPVDPIVPELVNGNFDAEWTTSMAPGWKNNGASGTSYTRVPNGDGYALGLTKAAGKGYTFRSESFNVQPNTYYTASIDIKLTPGNSCGLYIRYLDANGTQIENKAFIAAGDYSSEWSTVSVTVMAPANAKTGYILITDPSYSSGISLFDNAKFYETKSLVNPSFEACGWTNEFLPSGWVTYGANMAVNKDANYVKSGSQSYAIKAGKQPRSIMMNVKPGEEYEATVYVKREAGMTDDAKAQIYLRFFNKEGTRTANKVVDVTEFKANGWTKLSIKGVAQDGDVYSEIVITPASGFGWFYFDDASFKQLTNNDLVKNELTNGGFDNRTIKNANPVPKWYASSDNCIDYYALDYLGGERGYVTRVYNTTYTTLWTDPVAVTPGKTLSATVYGTGTGRVQACIYYYANETDARGAFLTKEDGKTSIGKFNTSSNLKEGVWTQVAVSGSVVPENAKYARLWVISLSDSNSGKLNMQMDDVCLFYGMPKLELPGKMGVISNPGFEELDASGNPVDWAPQGQKVFSIVDAKKNPDDVYEGRYALKLTVPKDLASTHGVRSELIPIQPGVTYKLSLYAKEGEVGGRGWQLYIDYLDKTGARAAAFYSTTTVTGEWNYCDVIGAAPDNAVCARILIVSGAQKGTVCVDKLELTAMGDDSNAPVQFKGDWSIADADHPRVYFNQERLAEIQRFSKSKATSAYGYAGTVTLRSLLTEADNRLKETKMVISHKGMELEYPMTPKLKDPTCRKEYEVSPEGFAPGYPYMTAVGQNIRNRMEALTLAYAITGEKKYGERAVQYALDICDWKYWVGYFQTVQEGSGELSSQVTGDLTDSVVMAYDMCYDLLTKAEREKIRETIIEKALEAMYHDCWPRMIRGRDMDHATCMLTAACAIMTKDNMDELKKYMDMGMTYVNWRLNHFMYSGVNEGHMYDSLAIDDIVVTLDVVERCTGYSGPWEHPYMEELAERVLAFFDPVNGTLPAYSDSVRQMKHYPIQKFCFMHPTISIQTIP